MGKIDNLIAIWLEGGRGICGFSRRWPRFVGRFDCLSDPDRSRRLNLDPDAFAAQFGMASVYGAAAGLSLAEITGFFVAIFTGSLIWQLAVGRLGDDAAARCLGE